MPSFKTAHKIYIGMILIKSSKKKSDPLGVAFLLFIVFFKKKLKKFKKKRKKKAN